MKQIIINSFLLLVMNACFSQNFTFSKISHNSQIKNAKGTISITNNSISITFKGVDPDTYTVRKVYERNDLIQYKALRGEDTYFRFTLHTLSVPEKNYDSTLTYETKDTFADTYDSTIYLITKEK